MSRIRQWWEFAGGALVLLGTKMRETAACLTCLCMSWVAETFLSNIVAIKRGNETIIPRGDDTRRLHDIAYFTTTKKYIPYSTRHSRKSEPCRHP